MVQRNYIKLLLDLICDKHPSTLGSLICLAILLKNMGKRDEAEQLYRSRLAKETLGDKHPMASSSRICDGSPPPRFLGSSCRRTPSRHTPLMMDDTQPWRVLSMAPLKGEVRCLEKVQNEYGGDWSQLVAWPIMPSCRQSLSFLWPSPLPLCTHREDAHGMLGSPSSLSLPPLVNIVEEYINAAVAWSSEAWISKTA